MMVLIFDKQKNKNITNIQWNKEDIDIFNWSILNDPSCAVDIVNMRFIVGQTGIEVMFDNLQTLQTYVDQYYFYVQCAFDPSMDGIKSNPKYDKTPDSTSSIISHTYVNTDIEKTLIQGK